MIKIKDLILESKIELLEKALKVDRHHKELQDAFKALLRMGHGENRHDLKKMEDDLINYLNNKLYKKYGKDVEIE